MSMTQFAMVEELAFLVKDNLPSKHLVLSMEEALVNFLKDDNSADGVLELEPMDSYNRLLLHRLADIFGFAHESVGEGDERHLILERCPETSIPSILVSDILWQYGEPQSPTTSCQLLRRKEAPPVPNTQSPSLKNSLEEREAAYLAARARIFSMDTRTVAEPVRQKPRSVPVVAQRMIAHALGQKVKTQDQDNVVKDGKTCEQLADEINIKNNDNARANSSSEAYQETTMLCGRNVNSHDKAKKNNEISQSERIAPQRTAEKKS
ncbi:R3H domain containing protein [Melia azedarach]|uniref:R3H domain containing protein n=1 Tax=Melia azedarach TaxID=155640 RepID=A0ACC1YCY9_MELAZ|nr:R3H domain containing protein [Melia azedarach]